MNLKQVAVSLFKALSTNDELLDLLQVPSRNMKDLKKQILENKAPTDLVELQLPRIAIYERPSSVLGNTGIEVGYIEIDIYVPEEINILDRKILIIAQKIIDIFKNTQIALGTKFLGRLPNLPIDNPEWVKYGLVFRYDKVNL